jgi:hypothetical protein
VTTGVAIALAAIALAAGEPGQNPPAIRPAYLFNVSNTQGDVPSSFASLAYDRKHDELYVVSPDSRLVRIYNDVGMEVYRFGGDIATGWIRSIAPLDTGDVMVLTRQEDGSVAFVRCDYRGRPIEPVHMTGIPASFGGFGPDTLYAANGKVYALDTRGMKVVVLRYDGRVFDTYDLKALVFAKTASEEAAEAEEPKKWDLNAPGENKKKKPGELDPEENEISGFGVDRKGNLLFTIATMFRAFRVTPGKELQSWGQKGSRPGRFNIVGPIGGDEAGYLYVADVLRSVVIVFDEDFNFLTEFGGRGFAPGRLILPSSIALGNGKVFVSQARNRGVSAYRVRSP